MKKVISKMKGKIVLWSAHAQVDCSDLLGMPFLLKGVKYEKIYFKTYCYALFADPKAAVPLSDEKE